MFARICFIFSLCLPPFICSAGSGNSDSFQVVAYNVENLFDVDGISLYNDYKEEMYGFREFENKLDAISQTLKKIGGESGPDVILFQEIEVDRTPEKELSATKELLRELKMKYRPHRKDSPHCRQQLEMTSSYRYLRCISMHSTEIKIKLH